jgi:hypothetical protein
MNIRFEDGKINSIAFYGDPKGVLYPIADLPAADAKLPRFVYDIQNKPTAETFIPPHTVLVPTLPYPSDAQRKAQQAKAPQSKKSNAKTGKK